MHTKKILATIVLGSISAFLLTSNQVNAANLNQALTTLPQNDDWAIMAYAAMGQTVGQNFLRNTISGGSATDYEKRILAITAIGGNPRTYASEDFVAKLETMFDGTQIGDPNLINDDIFGVLALKSAGITNNTTAKAREFILDHQNSNGGWGYATNSGSDSNMTAMAVAALSLTGNVPDSAYTYISSTQNSSGGYGFASSQEPDGASTAWVIMGFNTANRTVPTNSRSYLESLQLSSGSFKWKASDTSGSGLVTAYAVIALSGKGIPIHIGGSSPSPTPNPTPTPTPQPTPNPTPSPTPTPINSACLVPIFHTNFLFPPEGGRIIKIGEQMYFVQNSPACAGVTGTPVPTTPTPTPQPTPSPTPTPTPNPTPTNPVGNTCLVPIFHTNFLFPPEGGRIIKIGEQMYFVQNSPACAGVTGTPVSTPTPTQSTVNVKVSHTSRIIFNGPITFSTSENLTALSALQKAATQNNFSLDIHSTSLGTYVAGITGYQASGTTGWQYAVNGSTPAVPAASYQLHANDNLNWFFGAPQSSPY